MKSLATKFIMEEAVCLILSFVLVAILKVEEMKVEELVVDVSINLGDVSINFLSIKCSVVYTEDVFVVVPVGIHK